MFRRGLVERRDALSVVFSAILALFISTTSIGAVLILGGPYIDSIGKEKSSESAKNQFTSVSDSLKELMNSEPNDSITIGIPVDKGSSLSIDKNNDTTILYYSTDPNYDYTVSGLDDGDNQFKILMQKGSLTNVNVFRLKFDTCFLAGTKVLMADNSYKNIEDVVVGDFVKAYNEQTGLMENRKVVNVFSHSPDEMPDYYVIINGNLKVTPNHKFYSNGMWVSAGDLKVGDPLFAYNGEDYFVNSIEKVFNRVPSYNLEIEYCHTYFVSIIEGIDVLVHNPINMIPTVNISSPIAGQIVLGTFVIRGTASDSDGSVSLVEVNIDYGSSGPWQSCTGTTSWAYNWNTLLVTNGLHTIYARSKDNLGAYSTIKSVTVTVKNNQPPAIPSIVSPSNGATGVDINADLSWTCTDPDGDPLTYDVYFGTSTTPPLAHNNQTATTYDPGTLNYNTKYYWKITAWDNKGASNQSTTWSFTTGAQPNQPPNTPSNPNPNNGATNININADLSWTCTDPDGDPLTYDVYFGTSTTPPLAHNNQTATTYDPGTLNYNTKYYWKITAWDNKGASNQSTTWNFTTSNVQNQPPNAPSYPGPTDGATGVNTNTILSWTCSDPDGDPLTYDVYFGTDNPPTTKVSPAQSGTTYDPPGTLNYITKYYWKITAWDINGAQTDGDIWSFTTSINYPPNEPTNPSPANNSLVSDADVHLSWSCSDPNGDPLTYDVYFGTSSSSPPLVYSGNTTASYDVGILQVGIHYYWRIVANDVSSSNSSPVWNFIITESVNSRTNNKYIDPTQSVNIPVTDAGNNGIFTVSTNSNLEGTVITDLYDSGHYFGTIWLFNSISIVYNTESSAGTSEMILENGAIIEKNGDVSTIKNPPITLAEDNVLYFNIIQLAENPQGSYGSSSGTSKMNFVSKGNGMTRSDTYNQVSWLKLQIYGENKDTWLKFYGDNYNFNKEYVTDGDKTITNLKYNIQGLSLILYHSYIEASFIS